MAKNEKIKVVGVELRADGAAEFKKTNTEIRLEIDKIFASFKKEQEAMKLNGSEMDKLQSKKKTFVSAAAAQKKVVDNLKTAYDREKESGKLTTAETLQFQKAILNAETTLNRYQNQVQQTTTAIDNYGKETEQASNATKNVENNHSQATNILKNAVYQGVANQVSRASSALIDFSGESIQAAATAQATSSQFSQVFGKIADKAEASLQKISTDLGILPNRLRATFTQMAAFAKTTGVDTAGALDLTTRATRAAADSAAFYDRSIETVTENLQSFLKGNFENDAALGIAATETTRNAAANSLYGKSFIKLSEAQKQLTLLKMVEDGNKLSGALGQAAREMDGLENVTGNAKASWEEFQSTIGTTILPTFVDILKDLNPILKDIATWFKSLGYDGQRVVIGFGALLIVGGKLLPVFTTLQGLFAAMDVSLLGFLGTLASLPVVIGLAVAGIMALIYKFQGEIAEFFEWLFNTMNENLGGFGNFLYSLIVTPFQTVFESIIKICNGVIQFVTGVFTGNWEQAWNSVLQIFGGIWDGLAGLIVWPLNALINLINWALSGINTIKIPDWVPGVGGMGINIPYIPNIPHLAEGAIVTRETEAIIAEAGKEAVVPLTNRGLGREIAGFVLQGMQNIQGINANGDRPINVVVNLDGNTIATQLNDKLNELDTKRFNIAKRSNIYGKI